MGYIHMKHQHLHSFRIIIFRQAKPQFRFYSCSSHVLRTPTFELAEPGYGQVQLANPLLGVVEKENSFLSSSACSRLLAQCSSKKLIRPGMQLHALIVKFGFLDEQKLQNQLIGLYSKNGAFRYAHKLMEGIPESDVVSWTSLISGYVQNGLGLEALSAFQEMLALDTRCNEFTYASVLKACSLIKDLKAGKQIHSTVIVKGYNLDTFVGNSLVAMYAKCDDLLGSRRLFEEIPCPDVVTWNVVFSCYMQCGFCREAVALFQQMVISGMRPDGFSLSIIVSSCTGMRDVGEGKKIHGYVIKFGYDSSPYCSNALLDMYAKVGDFSDAIAVFNEIELPDIVSWNVIIAGCFLHELNDLGLEILGQMRRSGLCPDMFTLSSALKACAGLGLEELGKQLHCCLIKMDRQLDLCASSGLIDMYCKCGLMQDARRVFDSLEEKDLIAYNTLISGHSQNEEDVEALRLFTEVHRNGIGFDATTLSSVLKSSARMLALIVCEQVHALSVKSGLSLSDTFIVNGLIDSYGKCGQLESAASIFEGCSIRDVVSYTSLITVHAHFGLGEEAVKLYWEMQFIGLKPDYIICSALLNACADMLAGEQGQQMHAQIYKLGFMSDAFSGISLVNMYAKCGFIDDARCAFSEIPQRLNASWNAIIGGLAQHGRGVEALEFFDEMLKDGVSPSPVTMISVLYACNHSGLLTEGKTYFNSMKESYGIEPRQEHYACMVDLLGRAGNLKEALELINSMPFKANASVWGALLGASKRHKNIEIGEHAADMLSALEPNESRGDVLLANLYASVGMWDDGTKVRRLVKERKVNNFQGLSWVK